MSVGVRPAEFLLTGLLLQLTFFLPQFVLPFFHCPAGANRYEACAAGFDKDGSAVAAVLNEQQHQQQRIFAPIPTDIYGGYQLPDGSIAYGGYPSYPPPFQEAARSGQPAFYHDPVMFPHPGTHVPYPFPTMRPRGPSRSFVPDGIGITSAMSHGRKASAVGKYPPPEVAKTIPCRFYPNCRNGDGCIFAHIDGPTDLVSGPEGQHPSEGESMPPPPPGYYGVSGPYPPPFFIMPHGAGADSAGLPYATPPGCIPLHYQPHKGSQPGQITPAPELSPREGAGVGQTYEQANTAPVVTEAATPESASEEIHRNVAVHPSPKTSFTFPTEDDAPVSADVAANSAPITSAPSASQEDGKGDDTIADAQSRRRRQSFNSFLHTHAVPFQPSQMASSIHVAAVPIPVGPAARPGHAYGQGYVGRGKLRGRGGMAGMMAAGRGRHERGPCIFFARNACRYGSECLFAHILPDGKDARRPPSSGGPSLSSTSGARQSGQDTNASTGLSKDATKFNSAPRQPASVPLGPKFKKNAGLLAKTSAVLTAPAAAQAAQNDASSSKDNDKESKPVAKDVVPSKPSATATAAAVAASNQITGQTATKQASGEQASTAQQQQKQQQQEQQQEQQQQQPQQPSQSRKLHGPRPNGNAQQAPKKSTSQQRVPSGADFPALPCPRTVANGGGQSAVQAAPTTDGPSSMATSSTAPVKVNFSAILSAPAPRKKTAPTVRASAQPEGSAPADESGDNSAVVEDSIDGSGAKQSRLAGSDTPVVSGSQPKEKVLTASKPKAPNGVMPASRTLKASAPKVWGAKQGPAMAAPSLDGTTTDSDDFQIVKGRNHGKRGNGPQPPNSTSEPRGGGFANAAKAAVAA